VKKLTGNSPWIKETPYSFIQNEKKDESVSKQMELDQKKNGIRPLPTNIFPSQWSPA